MGQNAGSLQTMGPSEPPGKQDGREVKAKGFRRESEGRVLRSHRLPITGPPDTHMHTAPLPTNTAQVHPNDLEPAATAPAAEEGSLSVLLAETSKKGRPNVEQEDSGLPRGWLLPGCPLRARDAVPHACFSTGARALGAGMLEAVKWVCVGSLREGVK